MTIFDIFICPRDYFSLPPNKHAQLSLDMLCSIFKYCFSAPVPYPSIHPSFSLYVRPSVCVMERSLTDWLRAQC